MCVHSHWACCCYFGCVFVVVRGGVSYIYLVVILEIIVVLALALAYFDELIC